MCVRIQDIQRVHIIDVSCAEGQGFRISAIVLRVLVKGAFDEALGKLACVLISTIGDVADNLIEGVAFMQGRISLIPVRSFSLEIDTILPSWSKVTARSPTSF